MQLTKENTKIIVCCHKACELPQSELLLPVQVGAAIAKTDLGFQRDDMVNGKPCDNISTKNKSYCELTAIYWAWKNLKTLYPEIKYVGLCHYRRFFCFDNRPIFDDALELPVEKISSYKFDETKLGILLDKYDFLMSKKKVYPYSLLTDYSFCHVSEDMRTLAQIINDLHPEYMNSFVSVIACNNKLSPYNINVIGWDKFCSYCEWLFGILAEAEKRINIEHYNAVQARIWGYMAERLFNVWADYQIKNSSAKVKRLPILKFCEEPIKQNVIKICIRNLLFNLTAFLISPLQKIRVLFNVPVKNPFEIVSSKSNGGGTTV